MAKADLMNDDDGDEMDEKMETPKQPDSAKLNVGKAGSKMKVGALNGGLKRKPTRGGIAKPAVVKGLNAKKGL